ncbi:MAG: glycosyltransferase family 4 protein [Candidatus Lokiarchaeota archaeon]|nr:glycosyltransferase family 4 protein [Candidatus Lokiarchaeota archaeon]
MKLIYLGNINSPHVYKLAEYFTNKGHELEIYSEFEPKYKFKNIKYHWLINYFNQNIISFIFLTIIRITRRLPLYINIKIRAWIFKAKFMKKIRLNNTDIIHAHFASDYGYFAYHMKLPDIIISIWGSDILVFPEQSRNLKKMLMKELQYAEYIHASSFPVKNKIISDYNIEEEKIINIQYGLEKRIVHQLAAREVKNHLETFNIVNYRAAKQIYDNETFIQAAKLSHEQKLPFKFTLITDGSSFPKYQDLLRRYNISNFDLLHFMPQQELYQIILNYDIFVSCSLSDGLSISLLEAMAAKLYPIVSDIEANRSVISHEVNGMLFQPGNPADLIEKLISLYYSQSQINNAITYNSSWINKEQIMEENLNLIENIYKKYQN